MTSPMTKRKLRINREVEFVKNFFKHDDWMHHPAIFRIEDSNYEPDFYDNKRDVFIEVAGTRQAYHNNKHKYESFRRIFPNIKLEIRHVDGSLLNENGRQNWP